MDPLSGASITSLSKTAKSISGRFRYRALAQVGQDSQPGLPLPLIKPRKEEASRQGTAR